MKFEKGDIVYWMGSDKAFGIVIGDCEYYTGCYRLYANGSYDSHSSCSGKNLRHATHDEKGLLITALAKENKYYCEKTKTIKEMKKEFTKKDLKSGMWAKTRNGNTYIIIENMTTQLYGTQKFCLIGDGRFVVSDGINDDLTNEGNKEFDIIGLYGNILGFGDKLTFSFDKQTLIWERETEEDKQIKEMQNRLSEMKKAYNELEKNISETIDKLNGLKK